MASRVLKITWVKSAINRMFGLGTKSTEQSCPLTTSPFFQVPEGNMLRSMTRKVV